MKIISKRGKKKEVEVNQLDFDFDAFGIIIVDSHTMTPEEVRKAEEAIRDLRKQLEDIGRILDAGWFGKE